MIGKYIQNTIAESRWTLSVVSILSTAVWATVCINDSLAIVPFVCMLFSTFLMMELNNSNVLIRIFSRMVSCCYMSLTTMATFQFLSLLAASVVLCMVGFYTCIFRCYQDKRSPGWVFYAFLCLGFSSIVWVQALYFVPVVWVLFARKLLAASLRNYVSSLFGLLLPNLVALGILIYNGEWHWALRHLGELTNFGSLANYWLLSINQIITAAWVILCAIIGTVHYMRKKSSDSIRNRMLYGFFIHINNLSILFLCLQPQHFDALLGMVIASTSPLIAHFIALTRTKLTNITFKFLVLGTFAITLYNLFSNLR